MALPAVAAAATSATSSTNLVTNPSFESSVSGWTGYYAGLTRVSGGAEGRYSARVTATQSASWSISPAARQVASSVAGTTYTAKGSARTRYGSRSVCIRLREWSGSTVVAHAEQCVTTSSSWRAFPALTYTAQGSGRSLDLYAFSRDGRRGDSFDVDGLSLVAGSTAAPAPAPAPVPAPAPAPTPLAVSLTPPPAAAAGTVSLAASVTSGTASRVEFLADDTVVGSDTTSPYSYSWDTKTHADATVSLTARAVSSTSNSTSTPQTLRIDNTAPDSAFVQAPTGTVTVGTADVAFTATETSTFQCQLNSGSWTACSSPATLTNLVDGTYTYRVRATDSVGNVEPTPAAASWTVAIPVAVAPAPAPVPSVTCDRVAAPGGSDSNAGTLASPYATPQKLADTLASGQTGCLRAGTYTTSMLRITRSGFRIRSYAGERARIVGIVYFTSASSNVTLSHVDVEGTGTQNTIQVHGPDMVIEDNDITNKGRGLSCMILGDNGGWGAAHRAIVRRNTFHDCGATANGNKDHGIYAANVADGQILNNVFWNTASYAIHVYPNSQRMRVAYNVIDGAGPSVRGGIIVAGDASHTSHNNTIEYNVVAYAASYNIETYWEASVGGGNVARKNCVWAGRNGNITGSGLSAVDNLTADPLFVNRSAHDYRLSASSPCRTLIGTDPASNL